MSFRFPEIGCLFSGTNELISDSTLTFGPSPEGIRDTMASADFCRLMLRHSRAPRFRLSQTSPGKNADLHPMYLPHLPQCVPGSGRVSFCLANSPTHHGLICDFCSSGRDFATGFLQIPPRDGHPCLWLILLAAKRIADLHRQVCAHAGRTKNVSPMGLGGGRLNTFCQ